MSWIIKSQPTYIEVLPANDMKEHLAGDECWCNPETERNEYALPMISHNQSGEQPAHDWHDVSYATNLFMLKNGFTYNEETKTWSSKTDRFGNHLSVTQLVAEYFVERML